MTSLHGHVPILGWSFDRDAAKTYNADTWDGWDAGWTPIGSNGMGDAFVLDAKGRFCEVEHGTGKSPVAKLVSKDFEAIVELVMTLQELGDPSLNELSLDELKARREQFRGLKKIAPKSWRSSFSDALDDVKEELSDRKLAATPAGKLMAIQEAFCKKVYPVLRRDGRYVDVMIGRSPDKGTLVVVGRLRPGETIEEVREILSEFEAPVPLEFGQFVNSSDAPD